MIHSYLIQQYNVPSVVAKKAKINNKTTRDKVVRTKGKEQLKGVADDMDESDHGVSKMELV